MPIPLHDRVRLALAHERLARLWPQRSASVGDIVGHHREQMAVPQVDRVAATVAAMQDLDGSRRADGLPSAKVFMFALDALVRTRDLDGVVALARAGLTHFRDRPAHLRYLDDALTPVRADDTDVHVRVLRFHADVCAERARHAPPGERRTHLIATRRWEDAATEYELGPEASSSDRAVASGVTTRTRVAASEARPAATAVDAATPVPRPFDPEARAAFLRIEALMVHGIASPKSAPGHGDGLGLGR